jgi:hypothetical protein
MKATGTGAIAVQQLLVLTNADVDATGAGRLCRERTPN